MQMLLKAKMRRVWGVKYLGDRGQMQKMQTVGEQI